ncbi:histamine N-methyltransferase B isoform X1 [Strongylocentrotus purpuratus]|uniref:Histamine N-methyltransferase n=2 Tax=Strongylocentrotus purpuratus TaxID=7668 RepID=A0A7M7HQB9_STRPU|nr:histamine N-methyltransferase B isoform X1 [Strongylocentrotus purpuratus]
MGNVFHSCACGSYACALCDEANRRDSGMTTIEEYHYLDALTEFIRRCDQEEVMLAWIKNRCLNILNVLPIEKSSPLNPVRVVGVGCGNGIMDVQILRELSSLSAFTQQIAVEPNDSELLRFKARIEEDERLKSFTFDWIHATTEGFEATMNQLIAEGAFPKVHFVHMLQMLYHARDVDSTISNYYRALLDGGVMLITIASKKNNDLFKSFLDLEPKRNKQTPKNKKRYGDDVTRVLRRLGLKYDIENVIYHLDITECFKEDSKSGKLLLDFICLTNAAQVYQTLTTSDRDRLMKRLLDHCEQHPDGRVTVRLSFDAIVVTKSSEQTLLTPSSADSSAVENKMDAQ